MKLPSLIYRILGFALLGVIGIAHAEDIDIYQGNPTITGQRPNVLIVLDNSSNWNTPYGNEKAALISVLAGLTDQFNVGLLLGAENTSTTGGGYMRASIRQMTGTNKTALSNLFQNMDILQDKAAQSSLDYGMLMFEAYQYFSGGEPHLGDPTTELKVDWRGNELCTDSTGSGCFPAYSYSNTIYTLGAAEGNVNALSSADEGTNYTSPITIDANCGRNYIILISNGKGNDGVNSAAGNNLAAKDYLEDIGGSITQISLSAGSNGEQGSWLDEFTKFLYGTDVNTSIAGKQNIITYTIDVPPSSGYDIDHTELLKSAAAQGHGGYFAADNTASLTQALTSIFNEIQAVDSVFASVTLPVTVNIRSSFLNQVYMGVFRPDPDANPRWPGNLKQYKIGFNSGNPTLVDTVDQVIEDSTKGFIKPEVISFWTAASNFWAFSPSGTPLSSSDSPDGAIVEKGGAAQKLRTAFASSQTTRNLYTCTSGTGDCGNGSPLSSSAFDTDNTDITACNLGLVGPLSATLTRSASTVTAAYAAPAGCNFHDNQYVTFSSVSPAESAYAAAVISNVTSTSFTFTVTTTPALIDSSTTITASNAAAITSSISTVTSNSTLITVTTSAAHGLGGLSPMPNVTIAGTTSNQLNGASCAPTVISTTQFTCPITSNSQKNRSGTGGTISYTTTGNIAVTSLTRTEPTSGTSATATACTATAHGFTTSSTVTISGANDPGYNTSFTISAVGTNVAPTTCPYYFQFPVTVGPTTPVTANVTGGSTTRDNLINWIRGADQLAENPLGLLTDVRPSIHGDVLHSRPAVINYNTTGTCSIPDERDTYVFYGDNGGVFHGVKGGRDAADGNESWGVIFREFFNKLDRVRANAPAISSTSPKDYFADGSIGVYRLDSDLNCQLVAAQNDKVWIYVSLRRGGPYLYALDVTTPTAPNFLWKISNQTTGFSELGDTWSEPKTGTIKDASDDDVPVVIFGGGYDKDYDDKVAGVGTRTKGRAIYIVNAETGALIKKFDTTSTPALTDSIPADIAVIDRDSDGTIDRLYAADTGGNLWRVDVGKTDGTGWSLYKIASIAGSGQDARKFLFGPSVVFAQDGSTFDAVLIGSGDREKPFDTNIANRFYMFKDTNTGLTGTALNITESDLYDATNNLIQQGTSDEQAQAQNDLNTAKGWFIRLEGSGEKTTGGSTTVLGTTFFGTNLPKSLTDEELAACKSNLGEARDYAVHYLDASATIDQAGTTTGLDKTDRFSERAGGGLSPTPVPLQVRTDDGHVVTIVCSGPHCTPPPLSSVRRKTNWYQEIDN